MNLWPQGVRRPKRGVTEFLDFASPRRPSEHRATLLHEVVDSAIAEISTPRKMIA